MKNRFRNRDDNLFAETGSGGTSACPSFFSIHGAYASLPTQRRFALLCDDLKMGYWTVPESECRSLLVGGAHLRALDGSAGTWNGQR